MSLRTAVAHRNLLYLLSLKELRTRYRKSVLGWAWSLLNPLSQMVIFTVVFLYVFLRKPPVGDPSGLKIFPLYFLAGLLPFQFFSITVTASIGSVQEGASLIKKVAFPHEHLVLSIVIAQFVTLLIEARRAQRRVPDLRAHGPAVAPARGSSLMLLVALFTTGVALVLSAANVFFHDVNYLWGIVAQVLFYTSPIIYVTEEIPFALAADDHQLRPDRQLRAGVAGDPVRRALAQHRAVGPGRPVLGRHLRRRRVDLQSTLTAVRGGAVRGC